MVQHGVQPATARCARQPITHRSHVGRFGDDNGLPMKCGLLVEQLPQRSIFNQKSLTVFVTRMPRYIPRSGRRTIGPFDCLIAWKSTIDHQPRDLAQWRAGILSCKSGIDGIDSWERCVCVFFVLNSHDVVKILILRCEKPSHPARRRGHRRELGF
jgi:hypothetical protein